jgi:hypothetical protein
MALIGAGGGGKREVLGGGAPSQRHFVCHKSVTVCVADFAVCYLIDGGELTPSEQIAVM